MSTVTRQCAGVCPDGGGFKGSGHCPGEADAELIWELHECMSDPFPASDGAAQDSDQEPGDDLVELRCEPVMDIGGPPEVGGDVGQGVVERRERGPRQILAEGDVEL